MQLQFLAGTYNPGDSYVSQPSVEINEDYKDSDEFTSGRCHVEDYESRIKEGHQVFQIEPEIFVALYEEENEIKIDVISDKPEKPHIESEEYRPLVLVHPPTLSCTFRKPYKGAEVKERLEIFYNTDTYVLENPDVIDSFMLEVLNELLIQKKDVHHSLPKYIDAPFIVDISNGEGIT
ncbi:hypothetical protein Syun_007153 [Stephania yunnanensis]|uniref:Uncharacterized protein n=1 Tax=Stephania yunnanensis TaxID=152371 RepID=A0AAP0KXY0_9MAGN